MLAIKIKFRFITYINLCTLVLKDLSHIYSGVYIKKRLPKHCLLSSKVIYPTCTFAVLIAAIDSVVLNIHWCTLYYINSVCRQV